MEEIKVNELKIVLISDTHEDHRLTIPEADILIHAGNYFKPKVNDKFFLKGDFTNNGKLDKIIHFN